MDARGLHGQVEEAFNKGDVDALVALYEPDAQMVRDDGSLALGHDAIREFWGGSLAMGGRIRLETRFAIEAADMALLSNTWTFEGAGVAFSATSAEVAHRGPDGAWRYVIDNPFGLTEPPG